MAGYTAPNPYEYIYSSPTSREFRSGSPIGLPFLGQTSGFEDPSTMGGFSSSGYYGQPTAMGLYGQPYGGPQQPPPSVQSPFAAAAPPAPTVGPGQLTGGGAQQAPGSTADWADPSTSGASPGNVNAPNNPYGPGNAYSGFYESHPGLASVSNFADIRQQAPTIAAGGQLKNPFGQMRNWNPGADYLKPVGA